MAKEKIAIIGDSFSADETPTSWVNLLKDNYNITNYSQRGASEYRLYTLVNQYEAELSSADHIVMFHTNSLRVFVPDAVDYPSRRLDSHSHCDLVINDAFADPQWAKIAETYFKYFFDEKYLRKQYQLLISDIDQRFGQKIIHCSGFDEHLAGNVSIKSFATVREQHPGTTNHLDYTGNLKVYQYIKEKLC
jgi:hypothetical protein